MTTNAYPVAAYVPSQEWIDPDTGVQWITFQECNDFSDFKQFPSVLRFKNLLFAKMGFNSDKGTVHYREIVHVAVAV